MSGLYGEEERPISPSFEGQLRGASPSRPFVPLLPSEASRRAARPPFPPIGEVPEPGTFGHIRPEESITPRSEEPPYGFDEEPRAVPPPGAPRDAAGEPRAALPPGMPRDALGEPRAVPPPGMPRDAPDDGEPRAVPPPGMPRDALGEPRAAPPPGVSRAPTSRTTPGELRGAPVPRGAEIPEPATWGHIRPESTTQPSEEDLGEFPRDAPGPEFPRGAPGPEFPRGAPGPELFRAPTRGAPRGGPRIPSGPDRLEYDDAERARYERFAEIERQLADATQDAAEAEMRREHDFEEREAERERQFAEKQAERDRQFEEDEARRSELLSTLARQPGAPRDAPLPGELEAPERAESVVTSIRRAAAESAARHADELKDIVQGEREEMARQIQAEREDSRAAREALEQQMLAERKRADDERDARVRELEEELARVRAELDNEKQQRDHDEDMRREAESLRNQERDDEMRQQLSEITDLLLAHREEFARKKELVDERWEEKLAWRNETNEQFEGLRRMVQHMTETCTEEKERCEEERRAAAARPSESTPPPPAFSLMYSPFLSYRRSHE